MGDIGLLVLEDREYEGLEGQPKSRLWLAERYKSFSGQISNSHRKEETSQKTHLRTRSH